MAAKQTPMVMGRLVEHQEYFNSLATKDAQWVIQNPKDAAGLFVAAVKGRDNGTPQTERTYSVLRRVQPEPTPPVATSPFNANDTFFNKKAGVKMVNHGSNFTGWFTGKVEEEAPEGLLIPLAFTRAAYDREIIADLGGEEKAAVTLTEIWRLMKAQANGEKGDLLTNGYANIFYVCDTSGVLRALYVFWGVGGWRVIAYALDGGQWHGGGQVFSRNS